MGSHSRRSSPHTLSSSGSTPQQPAEAKHACQPRKLCPCACYGSTDGSHVDNHPLRGLPTRLDLTLTCSNPAKLMRACSMKARPSLAGPRHAAEERSLTSRTSRMCSTLTSIRNPAAVSAIPGPRISLNTLHPSELPAESGCWQNS